MKFTVMTLFPDMIMQGLSASIIGKACENGILDIRAVDMRDFTTNKHKRVDDYTYGGGAGMLLQAQPVFDAYQSIIGARGLEQPKVRTIYVTPQGRPFTQRVATELAREEELIFLCGHYEGIDARVLDEIVTDRISLGDYVLSGGELPAMVMIDAISRLVPGVLGNEHSAEVESFHRHLLEYPQYSRPEVWHDQAVPSVLLSGDRKKIENWRLEKSKELTKAVRPDLYEKYEEAETVLQFFMKKKRQYIHLIEAIRRGIGDICYRHCDENGLESVLIYLPSCDQYLVHASDPNQARIITDLLPQNLHALEVSDAWSRELLLQKGFVEGCAVIQGCYTEHVHLKMPEFEVRQLDESNLDYAAEHYHLGTRSYVLDRIRAGVMWGAFVDNQLVGFIGVHHDGSIGILYVDEAYRRGKIATGLEAYVINQHMDLGYIPYGQIVVGNIPSVKVQESMGLYVSDTPIWWMHSEAHNHS